MPQLQAAMAARLARGREEIRARHREGMPSPKVVSALGDLADQVIIELYEGERRAEPDAAQGRNVLVALGGYGRRELAPFSDLDLMVLHDGSARGAVAALAGKFFRRLWDLNCQVGHSVRSLEQCLQEAREDLTVRTSLMEARPLFGDQALFQSFEDQFWSDVGGRDPRRYIIGKVADRQNETGQFGSTTHLLEPNLKRSKGGLRDLHLIGWVGRVRYRTGDFQELAEMGLFGKSEVEALIAARDFLWKVRNELHFGAGRAQEVLTFEEQIRLARAFSYEGRAGMLDVERFMQDYYRHTAVISATTWPFAERAAGRPPLARLLDWATARRVSESVVARGGRLELDPKSGSTGKFETLESVLTLFPQLQRRKLGLAPDLHRRLQESIAGWESAGTQPLSREAAQAFLAILGEPRFLSGTLRAMRSIGLLGALIPDFAAVQGLMQFNAYHKYTVDEHSLRAVEGAETLAKATGPLADLYRATRRKGLLHLALLLHDLGKGREEDHCEVGRKIADRVSVRLMLSEEERQILCFLVHQHLVMAHTAFRRDLGDEKVILQFAKGVGSPETLALLYLLTGADLSAVGPGMRTAWKDALLNELYTRSRVLLTGEAWEKPTEERLAELMAAGLGRDLPEAWVREQLGYFPDGYLATAPRSRLADHLHQLYKVKEGAVAAHGVHDSATGLTEYSVYAHDVPGLFRLAAGALTSCGIEIVSAQIWTRPDGRVVDIFQVIDPDHAGPPPPYRLAQVAERMEGVLLGQVAVETVIASGQRVDRERREAPIAMPTRVEVDNESSDGRTIIDVFAQNQRGLLYTIASALFDQKLSIHGARISTHLDQAVDVFYVTDLDNRKVTEPERIKTVRAAILSAIDAVISDSQSGMAAGKS